MGRFSATTESLQNGNTLRCGLRLGSQPVSFAQVLDGWRQEPELRACFIQLLQETPFPAYFWEMPALTIHSMSQMFECVLVNSRALAGVSQDPAGFAEHFPADRAGVVTFPNLGGDAELIVPTPRHGQVDYAHLAAFSRSAPLSQQHRVWQTVAVSLQQVLSGQPTWLSSSGTGVHWLHLRIDQSPKYYQHRAYRRAC